ncbi:uncharacterized protein LOC142556873 [Primulina tabacum]|uniref:uncharacterized protein LOC142556873 n=1 Tax=Primulina tabacum TaxID=48773 RepID=UPI003F59A506
MRIMKANTVIAISDGASQMIEKHKMKWTSEDKKNSYLDNDANDILYKTLDKNTFSKIKMCHITKYIWDKLIQLYEDNDQIKENKLSVAIQKFDSIKMKEGNSMSNFDERVNNIIIEMAVLGKEYDNRKITLKIMRALPRE